MTNTWNSIATPIPKVTIDDLSKLRDEIAKIPQPEFMVLVTTQEELDRQNVLQKTTAGSIIDTISSISLYVEPNKLAASYKAAAIWLEGKSGVYLLLDGKCSIMKRFNK